MEVDREEFVSILSLIVPGLGGKNAVEGSPHFIFTGESIVTYNDRICVSYPFTTDFECSVPSNEFFAILAELKQSTVDISFCDDKISIKTEGFSACLSVSIQEDIVDLVRGLNLEAAEWRLSPDDFLEGLSLCMFSVSMDITESVLSCVGISRDMIVSSDNLRISRYVMEGDVGESFLIPASHVAKLLVFAKQSCESSFEFFFDGSWVHFRSQAGVVFSSRVVKASFYDFEEHFEFDSTSVSLPEDFKDAITVVAKLAQGREDVDRKVDIKIEGGKIRSRGERDAGWAESVLDIATEKTIKFSINPVFLSQILSKLGVNRIHCGEGKVMFQTARRKFKHLILLFME